MWGRLVYLTALCSVLVGAAAGLKAVDDTKLMEQIKSDYVVVFFQGKTGVEVALEEMNWLDPPTR